MKYLIGLEEAEAFDPATVGHKFSALARSVRIGISVPPAVAIHTAAHRFFFKHRRWPEGLSDEVAAAARKLNLSAGLSIRSSATREDLEKRSFAGQYQTFLKIVTEADLKVKIEECWQSAHAKSVESYLAVSGQEYGQDWPPMMAVILQKMVDAAVSGVAFGRDPMNPHENRVVIEATEGLAEKLVSGHISPYRIFVDGDGRSEIFSPPVGSGHNPFRPSSKAWREIAELVRKIEAHNDHAPQDIEWVIDNDKRLWLLQARSITTLKDRRSDIPTGVWTRKIADDLWADRLTPFLAEAMIRNAPRYDLTRVRRIVGIPTVRPTLAVINGYLYVNLAGAEHLLKVLPAKLRVNDIRRIFPPGYDIDHIPSPGIFRLSWLLARSLLLIFFDPGSNPLFCFSISRRHQKKIFKRLDRIDHLPADTPRDSCRKLDAAMETMVLIQEKNQWPYFFANFFTLFLRWFVVDRMGRSHKVFLDLLSSGGNNITIRIERRFREMARKINADPALRKQFLQLPREHLINELPEPLRKELDAFLSRYGSRSRHRTLLFKRWAEDPKEVIGILQSLVLFHSDAEAKDTGGKSQGRDIPPHNSGTAPRHPLNLVYQTLLTPILKLAVHYLDLREDLRFLLDQSLFQIRKAARRLGSQLGIEEKVFFLTIDELRNAVEGRLKMQEICDRASERHREFRKPADPPAFYVNGMPSKDISDKENILKGLGTSPGLVSGRARIVDDPTRADIAKGDILVASNTDPGWTPILSIVGGMIMEEGGLLNHCSIVARELGVPSIVGVRHARRLIPEGSQVTIDGGLGLVRIEGDQPVD